MRDQGSMLDDPCGGSGLLSIEIGSRRFGARCMCEKGQLRISKTIPLVVDVRGVTTEQLQELYPTGIPATIPAAEVIEAPVVGRRRRAHRRGLEEAYRDSKAAATNDR